ncbi:uncharacterized protein LOC120265847 [Dioscorea cayenensis subsp. rotundata]|uniref:Uncharacterized protein LOC120265847 n=1 Tax=Dioscorea cayennensis subsp. rotundata TaxID=55577 RepID=A0AB40BS71_DIOCR|nr:uncharacterized protein LOC120265847 [Dioscorea cayenensis subsp. rotundata]
MPKGKTSNKSKANKGLGDGVVEEPPGAAAWGAWFRPTPPLQSAPLTNHSIDSQTASTEVPETQNPDIGLAETEDAFTHDAVARKHLRGPNKVIPTPTNANDLVFITTLHDEYVRLEFFVFMLKLCN